MPHSGSNETEYPKVAESLDVVAVRGASLEVITSRMFCRMRVGLCFLH